MDNIVEFNNVNYLSIFKDFSLDIEKNKLTSLAGPNNSGKTTIVRLLSKQIETDEDIQLDKENINNYKITDYYRIVKTIIPFEETYEYETVEEELDNRINQLFLSKEETNKRLKNIKKNLNINKINKDKIKELSDKDIIYLQLAVSIATMPKLLVIDDISEYLDKEEMQRIIEYFRYLINNYDITILLITNRLEDIINTDYLYILNDSQIIIKDKPIEVLQNDNILNRVGLRLPFMMDLSVKLRDYNLIDKIELDMDRMINKLWN